MENVSTVDFGYESKIESMNNLLKENGYIAMSVLENRDRAGSIYIVFSRRYLTKKQARKLKQAVKKYGEFVFDSMVVIKRDLLLKNTRNFVDHLLN